MRILTSDEAKMVVGGNILAGPTPVAGVSVASGVDLQPSYGDRLGMCLDNHSLPSEGGAGGDGGSYADMGTFMLCMFLARDPDYQ